MSVASAGDLLAPALPPQQGNDSDQGQIQILPIAPQLNAQNVNVLTSGDVEQGNANNANTGQAAQQENTQYQQEHTSSGPSQAGAQANDSDQHQVQVLPIAPQVNLQNVNVATFGDVEQGNANNANTGQATQQENTRVAGHPKHGSKPCGDKCRPRPEPKPCPPKDEPKPCPPKHESKPCPPKHDGGSSAGQRNDGDQHQVQIVPIAPQVNLQNVNVLTFGDVEQGNANNANTGQAAQQSNRAGQLVTHAPKGGGLLPTT